MWDGRPGCRAGIGRKVKRWNGETELLISLWLLICEKCVALPTANARWWLTMTSMILMKCCVSRHLEGVSGKCSWRWVCEKTLSSDTLTCAGKLWLWNGKHTMRYVNEAENKIMCGIYIDEVEKKNQLSDGVLLRSWVRNHKNLVGARLFVRPSAIMSLVPTYWGAICCDL